LVPGVANPGLFLSNQNISCLRMSAAVCGQHLSSRFWRKSPLASHKTVPEPPGAQNKEALSGSATLLLLHLNLRKLQFSSLLSVFPSDSG
jgi:hypothetical protein